MIGTTQFINALVEADRLAPTAAIRLGLPATSGLPPFVGWPSRIRDAVQAMPYICHGGHEFDGREISAFSDYYEAVQRDPQELADGRLGSGDEIYEAEALAYTAADAYLRTSGGRDMYEDYPEGPSTMAEGEPSGTPWDEEEVDGLYPDLTPLPLPSD